MGLRFFKRRNTKFCRWLINITRLQWGCAFSSAEIKRETKMSYTTVLLQWGCAFSSAEIALDYISNDIHSLGFNGAALFQAQKLI